MRIIRGEPVSPGYAEGTAVLYERRPRSSPESRDDRIPADGVEEEATRLRKAVEAAIDELDSLRERVGRELGEAHAAIFAVQIGLLRDPQFLAGAERRIREGHVRAEAAVEAVVAELTEQLASTGVASHRERCQDIRDFGWRVLHQLHGEEAEPSPPTESPLVLVARELLPSDAVRFGRDRLAAIVTESGGDTSHTAILARALGVPSVTGVARVCDRLCTGASLLVDGETGELTIDPTETQRRQFADAQQRFERLRSVALAGRREPCVTRDGVPMTLRANVSRLDELPQIGEYHLAGVGLLRTEYLFMHEAEAPTFGQQVEAYRRIAAAAEPGPLTIRTFDFSADKPPVFIRDRLPEGGDPTSRGMRFSIREGSLLQTQLSAIVETARHADVRVLLPMVFGEDEVVAVAELLHGIAERRDCAVPPLGVMVETPEAVRRLDAILRHAEFLSVGTNDLTRLMLGTDREASESQAELSAAHPVILRALHRIARLAAEADRPAAVCGEAAGQPELACLLVGLGYGELSMSPIRSPHVRYRIRNLDRRAAERVAERAVRAETLAEVQRCFRDLRGPYGSGGDSAGEG